MKTQLSSSKTLLAVVFVTLLSLFSSLPTSGQMAQNWDEVLGGTNYDAIHHVHQTNDGGYVIVGRSRSDDGDVGANHNPGTFDFWVAKLDVNRNVVWSKNYGTSQNDSYAPVAYVSDAGETIIATSMSNLDTDFAGTVAGSADALIFKVNLIGDIQWYTQLTGDGTVSVNDLAYDAGPNITVAGHFSGPGGGDFPATTNDESYVARLDYSTGGVSWITTHGGSGSDLARGVDIDPSGNIYVVGMTNSTDGDFSTNQGSFDSYLVKLNSSGVVQWAEQLGCPSYDDAWQVMAMADGTVKIAGQYYVAGGDFTTHSAYGADFYIASYDDLGNQQWLTEHSESLVSIQPLDILPAPNNGIYMPFRNTGSGTTDIALFDGSGVHQFTNSYDVGTPLGASNLSDGSLLFFGETLGGTDLTDALMGAMDGFIINLDSESDYGCTDSTACNYDSAALFDDGSCLFGGCGCVDSLACNYDSVATNDDGSCAYATGCDACSGETDGTGVVIDNDADDDSVCDADEIVGCQDPLACNYDSSATDPGTCLSVDACGVCGGGGTVAGCIDTTACNYNSLADCDDGSCLTADSCGICGGSGTAPGCMDINACNYDSTADCDDGSCTYPTDLPVTLATSQVCDGESTTVTVSNTESGTIYTLRNDSDGSLIDGPTEGNGGDIVFNTGAISAATTYHIRAESAGPSLGSAIYFDGVDDHVELPTALATSIGSTITVEGWFDLGALDPNTLLIGAEAGNNVIQYAIVFNGSGIAAGWYNAGNFFYTGAAAVPSDWAHIASTYDGSTVKLFIDGVLVQSLGTSASIPAGYGPWLIAESWSNSKWNELTANEIRIWDHAKSDADILAGMTSCCSGAESGLLACYKFDDTPGSATLTDSSPNSFHGTIENLAGPSNWVTDNVCASTCFSIMSQTVSVSIANAIGCIDPAACNYDLNADCDDASCVYTDGICETCSGETDGTGTVVDNDSDDDGVCDADEIVGCQDPLACNYNTAATDAGACTYTDGICETCSGQTDGTGTVVDNDADDDGVCNADEVPGCMEPFACNYDSSATDNDGSCEYITCAGCDDSTACNYDASATINDGSCVYTDGICETCSGQTDGTGTVVDNDSDDDGVCDADEVVGCQDPLACNYNAAATDAGACTYTDGICETCSGQTDGTGTVVDNDADDDGVCDADEVVGCQDPAACNYNTTATDAGACTYTDGICETCSGETDGTGVVVDNDADDDGVCDADEVVGCQDILACNYNTAATDAGTCTYTDGICETCSGQTDGTGSVVDNDADDDGVCDADEVPGCMEPFACNYNSSATDNDGSCEYITCAGCDDSTACNYDASATINDGSCVYTDGICETCSGQTDGTGTVVDNDADDDGVCDADEIVGCQDISACNYNAAATDAGACTYTDGICETCSGETDGTGTVVDNDADDDGVCDADEVIGCQDTLACNYNAAATDAGACTYTDGICETCSGETDGTGTVVDNDADDDGVCDADEVVGCQDILACNYNTAATDAGACTYTDGICETCSGQTDGTGVVVDNDADDDGVCDADEVVGCQDPLACNYNAAATDAGACTYTDGICETCSGETDGTGVVVDNDADDDGVCDADEVTGCTDSTASNYNSSATEDDGSCVYDVFGCSDSTACNYDSAVTVDDGSCTYPTDLNVSINPAVLCDGETAVVTVANSESGTFYTLRDESDDSIIDGPYEGNGGDLNFSTGSLSASATYNVYAEQTIVSSYAYHMDGTGYTADLPALGDQITGNNVTIEGWFNVQVASGSHIMFIGDYITGASGNDIKFTLFQNSSEGIRAGFHNGGWALTSGTPMPSGWTHIAVTYDQTEIIVYVNGVQADSHTTSNALPVNNGPWKMNNSWHSDLGQNNVEYNEVRVWNEAKSAADIVAGMTTCCNGSEANLIACYSFDDAPLSSQIADISANANHGTRNGTLDPIQWLSDNQCPSITCSLELSQTVSVTVNNAFGCTDVTACNYDSAANCDDTSCIYTDGICETCSGQTDGTGTVVDNDADDDGVCDADEIVGCQDPLACNYNTAATDAGACTYTDGICETCSGQTDGTGVVVDNDADDDGVCNADEVVGCQDISACNYNAAATDAGACTYTDGICETCSGETDGTGVVVDNDADDDGVCDADEVPGCMEPFACNYDSSATDNDGSCEYITCAGCDDSTACNYDASATINDGSCVYTDGICETCSGQTDGTGIVVDNDSDDDGVCDADEVVGCQDPLACNYDSTATDPGTCLTDDACGVCGGSGTVAGCIDTTACNYSSTADCNDGSCIYDDACGVCGGSGSVAGCVDSEATNFNPAADCDDGSCYYEGCTDLTACNYDPTADTDDGSCTYPTDLPVAASLTTVCSGEGTSITVSNSEVGFLYSLRDDADNSVVDGPYEGNGGDLVFSTGALAATTTFNVYSAQNNVSLGAINFDGTNDYAELPIDVAMAMGSTITVEGWFNITSMDQYSMLIGGEAVASSIKFMIYADGSNIHAGWVGGGWPSTPGYPMPTGGWAHIAASYDGSAINLYVDGVLVSTQPHGGPIPSANAKFFLGKRWDNPQFVEGDFNEVRFWNYARTEAEIQSTMNICSDGSETGLIACYPFDDTPGNMILTDVSPNGYHGTLIGVDGPANWVAENVCPVFSGCAEEMTQLVTVNVLTAFGCMDSTACNYDSAADCDDASCVYVDGICDTCSGETDGTGVVVDNDVDDDGVCDADEVVGCQDPLACNYDSTATDPGTCLTLDACGVCGGSGTIVGCIDSNACNYNVAADCDDASCVYATGCETCSGETDGTGTVIDNDADDDGVCDADEVVGCQDPLACNYDSTATDPGTCLTLDACGVCGGSGTVAGCMDSNACNYNTAADCDDASCVFASGCDTCSGETDGTGVVIDNDADDDGVCDADEVVGCQDPSACNYDSTATDPGTCLTLDACGVCGGAGTVAGCMDSNACNYNVAADCDDASCVFATGCDTCSGETDGTGVVVDNDADDDGVCDADEVVGCQDPSACNYDSTATDTGTCLTLDACGVCGGPGTVAGCMDSNACNYNAAADCDDASCVYTVDACDTCSGETDGTGVVVDNDADDDGVCDADEVVGCQDALACDYDSAATDAGACTYASGCDTCSGETDGTGTVVDNDSDDDGVCDADEVVGCQDVLACNYNSAATDAGACVYATGCDTCSGETDGTGTVLDGDADDDGVCDADEVPGCTDSTATNYDPAATDDDGSCTYVGCTYSYACNYDPAAISDDGSCEFISCQGCTYDDAINYDSNAVIDDGSCLFDITVGCQADLDANGEVNTADLLLMLQVFGTSCD